MRAGFHVLRFIPLFILGLINGLIIATPSFYNAQFLTWRGLSEESVELVYIAAAVMSLLLFAMLPQLLRTHGVRRVMRTLIVALILSTLGLAAIDGPLLTLVSFIVFFCTNIAVYSLVDVLLEAKTGSHEGITGRVRGLYLAVVNAAYIAGPYIAGVLVAQFSFSQLYFFVALMGVVFLFLALHTTRDFKDPHYPRVTLLYIVRSVLGNRMVRTMLAIQFLLRLLYAVIVVYITLYLHNVIGIPLDTIGFLLALSIVPFVVVQFPLGLLGDTMFGEREFLAFGFVLASLGALAIPTAAYISIPAIALALLVMHTGAAFVEIMSESYFFKHISGKDDAHIMAFRMLVPLAYVIGPLVGGMAALLLPTGSIFTAIGVITALGIPLALSLKDTK
ncbi:MAG: MFS transporter [Parcubacteria group bacterium]|nr:MFS transporter [Parcubacteria group bacterium]